ncbi:MAG: hypothetical protein AB7P99_06925 [Vicinamibacterales bacterium]
MAISAPIISAAAAAVGAGASVYSALDKPARPKQLQAAVPASELLYGRQKQGGAPKAAIAALTGTDGSGGLAKSNLLGK